MKTIEETIKDTITESLEELRSKSISNIETKGVEERVEDIKVREKAIIDAFNEFLRTGVREKAVEMSAVVEANGGYTVPENIFDRILEKAKSYGVMREEALRATISMGNSMEFILEDGDFGSAWVSETDGRTDTNAGTFKQVPCKVFEMWAEPVITRQLLADSMFDLEGYIVRKVGEIFGKAEETAFWKGTGDSANQPTGLLNGVASGDYTGITYANLTSAIYDLAQDYANGAKFYMNRKTMKAVKNLVDGNNMPIFVDTRDIERKYDGYLLGYPVRFTEGLAEGEIVFGDLSNAYGIVDKSNDQGIIRDDVTVKGKVKMATWKRCGGAPLRREAYKYIKDE